MEQVPQRYDAVSQSHPNGLVLNNDAFAKWSAKTKWVKSFYNAKFLPMESNALVDIRPPSESRTTDADRTQESYRAPPTVIEGPAESSTNPFTFGGFLWPSFGDPSAFLEDLDFGLADVKY